MSPPRKHVHETTDCKNRHIVPGTFWKHMSLVNIYIFYFVHFRTCNLGKDLKKNIISLSHVIVGRVFASGPGDRGSILDRVIPKTQKMVFDASLLNTQHYKVRIKAKVEQSREESSALPFTTV